MLELALAVFVVPVDNDDFDFLTDRSIMQKLINHQAH